MIKCLADFLATYNYGTYMVELLQDGADSGRGQAGQHAAVGQHGLIQIMYDDLPIPQFRRDNPAFFVENREPS
jgi:hypothetical protein